LIPIDRFGRWSETYCTLVRYTYPPYVVGPEKVVPFVKFAVGMRLDCRVALPTS
jgi:hypothetical protein